MVSHAHVNLSIRRRNLWSNDAFPGQHRWRNGRALLYPQAVNQSLGLGEGVSPASGRLQVLGSLTRPPGFPDPAVDLAGGWA